MLLEIMQVKLVKIHDVIVKAKSVNSTMLVDLTRKTKPLRNLQKLVRCTRDKSFKMNGTFLVILKANLVIQRTLLRININVFCLNKKSLKLFHNRAPRHK